LFSAQKALSLLRDRASVILAGSTPAITGIPAFSVYSASKAAIRNFARGWIIDLAPRRASDRTRFTHPNSQAVTCI
jgi:NAD(P)-dependent dehydrogenase (short-subunit alcohol dehydrogenase family)